MDSVHLHYHQSDNFGDALAPWLIRKLSPRPPFYVTSDCPVPHYVICGSILSGANENAVIWGAGLSKFNEPVSKYKEILRVRGKLTRDMIMSHGYSCPEVYGDPGILLSRLYQPQISKKYKLGIMAHWVDYDKCLRDFKPYVNLEVNVIDLMLPTEQVIDEMLKCENIISSSLHGLIAAHSYGLPSAWVEFSDKVIGNGFKFFDYFSSINMPYHQPLNLREKKSLIEILPNIQNFDVDPRYIDAFLNSCPFK